MGPTGSSGWLGMARWFDVLGVGSRAPVRQSVNIIRHKPDTARQTMADNARQSAAVLCSSMSGNASDNPTSPTNGPTIPTISTNSPTIQHAYQIASIDRACQATSNSSCQILNVVRNVIRERRTHRSTSPGMCESSWQQSTSNTNANPMTAHQVRPCWAALHQQAQHPAHQPVSWRPHQPVSRRINHYDTQAAMMQLGNAAHGSSESFVSVDLWDGTSGRPIRMVSWSG